jgi:hypothetical protein
MKQYGVIGTANTGVGIKDRHGKEQRVSDKPLKNPPDPTKTHTDYENAVAMSHELTDPQK